MRKRKKFLEINVFEKEPFYESALLFTSTVATASSERINCSQTFCFGLFMKKKSFVMPKKIEIKDYKAIFFSFALRCLKIKYEICKTNTSSEKFICIDHNVATV